MPGTSLLDTLSIRFGGGDVGSNFLSWLLYGLLADCSLLDSFCVFRFVMAVCLWLVFTFLAVGAHVL